MHRRIEQDRRCVAEVTAKFKTTPIQTRSCDRRRAMESDNIQRLHPPRTSVTLYLSGLAVLKTALRYEPDAYKTAEEVIVYNHLPDSQENDIP